ncbi:MAG: hypothetical protein OEU26_06810 [Candidatus Tectomicrobia bacterium]|nr:hypothetical protein [Candidatus Tectomicrobia bacterium]
MADKSQPPQETLQLRLDAVTFKELLRDLIFRETGKPYFKQLHIPRQRWRRMLGDWQPLTTYQAERELLPVGGRDIDARIRQFFITYERLQAEFHEGGMPVTAIYVLRQRCLPLNAALEHVHLLECASYERHEYRVDLHGGPAPPPDPRRKQAKDDSLEDDGLEGVYISER